MADNKQTETTNNDKQQPARDKEQDKQNASSNTQEASAGNEQATEEQEKDDEETQPAPEPTLVEDYARLKNLHLLKAVMIRQKAGRHPSAEIDSLLKRRMNFTSEDFQGPYVVRLINTLLMIFVFAAAFWAVLWILASGFNLNYFIKLLSTGMATLVAAVAGIAVFYPSSLPDEKILKKAIDLKMKELANELEPEKDEQKSPKPEEELLDSSLETKQEKEESTSLDEDTLLSPMPEGLKNFKEQTEKPQNKDTEQDSNDTAQKSPVEDESESVNEEQQKSQASEEKDTDKETEKTKE